MGWRCGKVGHFNLDVMYQPLSFAERGQGKTVYVHTERERDRQRQRDRERGVTANWSNYVNTNYLLRCRRGFNTGGRRD